MTEGYKLHGPGITKPGPLAKEVSDLFATDGLYRIEIPGKPGMRIGALLAVAEGRMYAMNMGDFDQSEELALAIREEFVAVQRLADAP